MQSCKRESWKKKLLKNTIHTYTYLFVRGFLHRVWKYVCESWGGSKSNAFPRVLEFFSFTTNKKIKLNICARNKNYIRKKKQFVCKNRIRFVYFYIDYTRGVSINTRPLAEKFKYDEIKMNNRKLWILLQKKKRQNKV